MSTQARPAARQRAAGPRSCGRRNMQPRLLAAARAARPARRAAAPRTPPAQQGQARPSLGLPPALATGSDAGVLATATLRPLAGRTASPQHVPGRARRPALRRPAAPQELTRHAANLGMLAAATVNPDRRKHFYLGFQAEHKLAASGAHPNPTVGGRQHLVAQPRPQAAVSSPRGRRHRPQTCRGSNTSLAGPCSALEAWAGAAPAGAPHVRLLCGGLAVAAHTGRRRLAAARHACVLRMLRPRAPAVRRREPGARPERVPGGAHGGQGGRVRPRHGLGQDPVLCRRPPLRHLQGAPGPAQSPFDVPLGHGGTWSMRWLAARKRRGAGRGADRAVCAAAPARRRPVRSCACACGWHEGGDATGGEQAQHYQGNARSAERMPPARSSAAPHPSRPRDAARSWRGRRCATWC